MLSVLKMFQDVDRKYQDSTFQISNVTNGAAGSTSSTSADHALYTSATNTSPGDSRTNITIDAGTAGRTTRSTQNVGTTVNTFFSSQGCSTQSDNEFTIFTSSTLTTTASVAGSATTLATYLTADSIFYGEGTSTATITTTSVSTLTTTNYFLKSTSITKYSLGGSYSFWDTLYFFATGSGFDTVLTTRSNEQMWNCTFTGPGSTSGFLSDICNSFSNDFTSSFSGDAETRLISSSFTAATSSSAFAQSTFTTSYPSSLIAYTQSTADSTSMSEPFGRQFFLGTDNLDLSDSVAYPYLTSASSTRASSSFSVVGTSVSTYTTSRSELGTVSTTITATASSNAIQNDNIVELLPGPDVDFVRRTTTVPTSTLISTVLTSAREAYRVTERVNFTSNLTTSFINATGGRTEVRWTNRFATIGRAGFGADTHLVPTAPEGILAFDTAGQQSSFYKAITCAVDPGLAPFEVFIGQLYSAAFGVQQGSVYAMFRDRQTFTLNYGNSDGIFEHASATGKFVSVSGSDAIIAVTLPEASSNSGQITFGLVSAAYLANESGHASSDHTFLGGCRAVTDALATVSRCTAPIYGTTLDSLGGSTTGSGWTTANATETVPSTAMAFRSVAPLYTATFGTGFVDNSTTASQRFQTTGAFQQIPTPVAV